MKKKTYIVVLFLALILLLTACAQGDMKEEDQTAIMENGTTAEPLSEVEESPKVETLTRSEVPTQPKTPAPEVPETKDPPAETPSKVEETPAETPSKTEESPKTEAPTQSEVPTQPKTPVPEVPETKDPPAETPSKVEETPAETSQSEVPIVEDTPGVTYDTKAEYDAVLSYITEKGCEISEADGRLILFWYDGCRCQIYDHIKNDGVWDFQGGDSLDGTFWYRCEPGELLNTVQLVVK